MNKSVCTGIILLFLLPTSISTWFPAGSRTGVKKSTSKSSSWRWSLFYNYFYTCPLVQGEKRSSSLGKKKKTQFPLSASSVVDGASFINNLFFSGVYYNLFLINSVTFYREIETPIAEKSIATIKCFSWLLRSWRFIQKKSTLWPLNI